MTSGRDKKNHVKISRPLIDFYTFILIQLNRMIYEISHVMLRYLAKNVCVSLSAIYFNMLMYLFLCGLHELYSHIMVSPDLFISLFIYLFVYESRASVTWSSRGSSIVVLVVSLGSSNFFSGDRITS